MFFVKILFWYLADRDSLEIFATAVAQIFKLMFVAQIFKNKVKNNIRKGFSLLGFVFPFNRPKYVLHHCCQ